MSLAKYLLFKYLRFDKSQPFITLSAVLAFLGVSIGLMVLIVAMAIMNGFDKEFERKLFTINTGHAAIAYLAYQKGIKDICTAMKDLDIVAMARLVWQETSELLVRKYGFDRAAHEKYVITAEKRFSSPYISDDVTRVARGPVRKLSVRDRLTSPALQLMEQGVTAEALAAVIAAALHFDYAGDQEAVEVQSYIKEHGMAEAISHFTEIPANSKLYELIEKKSA